ncbi:MAG TPA: HAD-IIB family hydrolase [Longimicrobiaceae bacterium]|jgi:Cof subfamily protein (haloacid dehalogenase superfamily)|nr:HAD-IIB family hydrolase [Longimicrobiaceae bacterium]
MIRLVCIDVDGTLVGSSGTVPDEVWDAAARARDAGLHLALCSGRPALGLARELAERLDPGGWHVFQNGASLVNLGLGESRSHGIETAAVDRLVERARRTGRALELYGDRGYVVECSTGVTRRHARLLGVPFEARPFESLDGPVVRAQWLVPHAEVPEILREPNAGLHLSPSLSPVMPDITFVNMTPAGVDKASAVRDLAALHDVPLERVMMVGDGANDLGVMRVVGHPVAMGNAEPEVFGVAHRRVGHVDEGGLVDALDLALRI